MELSSLSHQIRRPFLQRNTEWPVTARIARAAVQKYRLTVLFAITAIALTAAAAILVNIVVGNLAENNLIRIAEENTARDGSHIQSMMRGSHSMGSDQDSGMMRSETMEGMEQATPDIMGTESSMASGKSMKNMERPIPDSMSSGDTTDSGKPMQNMEQASPLTLESLSGPMGLPRTYSSLVLSQLGFGNCLRKRLRLLPFFRSVDVGGWQPWDENGMWSGWKGKNETSWND